MTRLRPFRRGLNRLDARLLNRIIEAVCWVEGHRREYDSFVASRRRPETYLTRSFWAVLTGYKVAAAGQNRWAYAWREAIWDDTVTRLIEKPGGLTSGETTDEPDGVFTDPAYNAYESGNNGGLIESSINVDGADFPDTFYLQPIQGDWAPDDTWDGDPGTDEVTWLVARGVGVRMYLELNASGSLTPVFSAQNVADGLCPT